MSEVIVVIGAGSIGQAVARRVSAGKHGEVIEIGGHGLSKSKKWRDLQANSRVAFVVDDLESVNPWTPRGIEIRGRAELHLEGGVERFGAGGWDASWLSVVPQRIVSWGIERSAFSGARPQPALWEFHDSRRLDVDRSGPDGSRRGAEFGSKQQARERVRTPFRRRGV